MDATYNIEATTARDMPLPAGMAVDPGVLVALHAAGAPALEPGQLWRLSAGDGPVVLVWVRRLRSIGSVAVVPVSFNVAMADDYSLVVLAASNPLGVDLVLHTTAESSADRRSFRDMVGTLDVAGDVEVVRAARRHGARVGLPVGLPIRSLADERVEFRQQLSASLVPLATAAFDPDTSDADPDHDLPFSRRGSAS